MDYRSEYCTGSVQAEPSLLDASDMAACSIHLLASVRNILWSSRSAIDITKFESEEM